MNTLDIFLDKFLPIKEKVKHVKNQCCLDKENIIYDTNSLWNVCCVCGVVMDTIKEVAEYKSNISFIVKSFIQVSYKYKNLVRLQIWNNYSYSEVRDNKLMKLIDRLPINDKEVLNFTKIIFFQEFRKVRTRAKVKMGLLCYCIYKAHLMLKKEIEINDLFDLLEITGKNYNSAVKKLTYDKLFYPTNIDNYLNIIDNKINKNYLIGLYNDFLEKYEESNGKIILLSLIYIISSKEKKLNINKFLKKFKISKNFEKIVTKFVENKTLTEQPIDDTKL